MHILGLTQMKEQYLEIYNDFKEVLEQFQQFLKSELFIHFIISCTKQEKEEWENILATTIIMSQKIDSQQFIVENFISYNQCANNFFNNILGKYLLPETKNILEKIK